MNKRQFFKSLGAVAVGCMLASGLSWKPTKLLKADLDKPFKIIKNPDYANAKYEIKFLTASGVGVEIPWPARSNNPNALRDKDFIPPFIGVDA